jgi:serine/threonine protein kinase
MSKNPLPVAAFDLTGVTLGKYRLVEKLGQGGMAQVYKAYQADLDRYVAVKVLHPHLTGDEDFGARFRREARAVAALEHPQHRARLRL